MNGQWVGCFSFVLTSTFLADLIDTLSAQRTAAQRQQEEEEDAELKELQAALAM